MATEDVESVDGRSGSRCSAARLRSYLRVFLTHLFSHVGLCGLVVGYAIVGALTFQGLESPNEEMTRAMIAKDRSKERDLCMQDMWIITENFNVLHKENWTEAMMERLKAFEEILVTTINERGYKVDDASAVKMQWSFSGALLYSVTVITTIGYGNIAPKTEAGKLVTILYALIGVPLMLLCLTNIGDLLANAFKFAYARLCCVLCRSKKRRYRPPRSVHCDNSGSGSGTRFSQPTPDTPTVKIPLAPSEDVNEEPVAAGGGGGGGQESTGNSAKSPSSSTTTKGMGDDGLDTVNVERLPRRLDATETRVPIALVLAFVAGYLCLGAAIFSLWEEWTFLNGAYFCFITLSTIGFGDLVPGTGILEPGKQEEHFRLIVCCVYLILGLAVIAMSFNLVQAEVTAKCKQIGRNLGILVDDDSSDD